MRYRKKLKTIPHSPFPIPSYQKLCTSPLWELLDTSVKAIKKIMTQMNYDVIALACQQLSYRDKLRLAQLLIQLARKEEENANPQHRQESTCVKQTKVEKDSEKETDNVKYIIERLLKLKPVKKKSLVNSIKSMFQFQGGISDSDIDKIIEELQKQKYIKIDQNRVSYLKYSVSQSHEVHPSLNTDS